MTRFAILAGSGGVAALGAVALVVMTGAVKNVDSFGRGGTGDAAAPRAAVLAPDMPDSTAADSMDAVPSGTLPEPPPEAPAPLSMPQDPKPPPAEPDPADPPATPAQPAGAILPPKFDIVRVDPQGMVLVAGTGASGARIEILVDGGPLAEATAGADGSFVSVLDLNAGTGPRVFTLRQTLGDAVRLSDEEVFLARSSPERSPGAADGAAPVTAFADPPDGIVPPVADRLLGAPAAVQPPGTGNPGATARLAPPARIAAGPAGGGRADGNAPPGRSGIPAPPPAPRAQPAPDPAPGRTDAASAPQARAAPGLATAAEDHANRLPPASDPAAPPDAATGTAMIAEAPDADAPAHARRDAPDPAAVEPGRSSSAAAPETPADPDKPAVFLSDAQGVQVMQAAPLAPGDVALDAINYDSGGDVLLSGRGEGRDFVRVYLDNRPVTTSRIRADGRWRLTLPEVETGTYTLRVDQIDAAGAVTARVESPFLRESRAALYAAVPAGGSGPFKAVTIQPGDTLWAISRERYGEGIAYVRVFEANRDRIRDPDLIYPGQIFDLPDD